MNAEHFSLMKFHWFLQYDSDEINTRAHSRIYMHMREGIEANMSVHLNKRNHEKNNCSYIGIGSDNLVLVTIRSSFSFVPSHPSVYSSQIYRRPFARFTLKLCNLHCTRYTIYLLSPNPLAACCTNGMFTEILLSLGQIKQLKPYI